MECRVCGQSAAFSLYMKAKKHHPSYWRCVECGFVFAHPQLPCDYSHYRFIAPNPSELTARLANYALRYGIIEEFILSPHPRVLDIGTNCGIFLKYLQSKNIEGEGIEPNQVASHYGRTNFQVKIDSVSLEDYQSEKKFDVITMFNVLEHVEDLSNTIHKVKSLLYRDGVAAFEVPNIFHLLSLLSSGYWHHFEPTHNWFFDRNTMVRFMRANGFRVRKACFIPKIVTLAKCVDGALATLKIYDHVSMRAYLRLREKSFYKWLNSVEINVGMCDYLLVICTPDD